MTSDPDPALGEEELRQLLVEARAAVEALLSATVNRPDDDAARAELAWFDKWRDEGVRIWNRLTEHLAQANQEMVFAALQEIRSLGRAILENADWTKIAPGSVGPHARFADHLQQAWARLPAEGSPEVLELGRRLSELRPAFRPLEFRPLESRPPAGGAPLS